MTSRELVALMAATSPHLTDDQRELVARFVGTLTCSSNSARTDAHRSRREAARRWEEHELSGADGARRMREPA